MENTYMQNHIPSFEVAECDQRLRSPSRHAEYLRYRAQYRERFGVLPELDKINNPTVAIPTQDVYWPGNTAKNSAKSILKAVGKTIGGAMQMGIGLMTPGSGNLKDGFLRACEGFGKGRMQNPELMAEFCRRFNALIEPHKAIYPLLFDPDILPAFDSLAEGMHVTNSLGYFYDRHNQLYLEGTWAGGELVYGLWYSSDKAMFIGSMNKNMWNCVGRKGDVIEVGCIDAVGMECEEGFFLDLEKQYAFLGPFHKDQLHGVAIVTDISTGDILKQEYEMDEPVKGVRGLIGRQKAKLDTHKNTINNSVNRFAK